MTVKNDLFEDDRYKYAFSVEDVNQLVQQGVPFRDAYKQVGIQIADGTYLPGKKIVHTHEGSIGNLCLPDIELKMENVISGYNRNKVDQAFESLLTN